MSRDVPSGGELFYNFVRIARFAIKRTTSYRDFPFVFLILTAPLLHLLRFRGELKTPIGNYEIQRNDILRWTIYGVFKTRFCYVRMLETTLLRNNPRSIVVDVGANLGDFSMAVSSHARRVLSLEPGRENFALLCSNLHSNSLNQVIPLNIAAHDTFEDLSLIGNGADLRVSTFDGGERIRGMPLDDVLQTHEIDYVDVLKIDVQGHETQVLNGMSNCLKAHKVGLVIVEVHVHRNIKASDVISLMQKFGYRRIATDYLIGGRPQLYFK